MVPLRCTDDDDEEEDDEENDDKQKIFWFLCIRKVYILNGGKMEKIMKEGKMETKEGKI